MRPRSGATVVHKAMQAVGTGMLQLSLELEGGKGCSPFVCIEPVALEPPYQTFDSNQILSLAPGTTAKTESSISKPDLETLTTFEVYASDQDILSLPWMTTLHMGLSVLPGRKAFEVIGNEKGVLIRFAVHQAETAGFRTAVLGLFPAVRLREIGAPFPRRELAAVHEAVPVGPYHRTLTLLGSEGASPLGPMVAAMGELPESDLGLFQIVYSPVHPDHDWHYNLGNLIEGEVQANRFSAFGGLSPTHSYDPVLPPLLEITAQEKVKVDVAFYATVSRFGVWSGDTERIRTFLQGMRVALGLLRFGNRSFRFLDYQDLVGAIGRKAVDRMVTERISHRPGLLLTSREIASMVHIPADRTLLMHPLILQRKGYQWTPFDPEDLETAASSLGTNTYAGETREVSIPFKHRTLHTYVLGTTGQGKSNQLTNMALEDIENGLGVCVLDPHGDLVWDILSMMPEHRMKDLEFLSFSIPGWVLPWNPFKSDAPSGKVADDIAHGFLAIGSSSGPRMEHNFRMLAYVIHKLGGTLNDFAELISRSGNGEMLRSKALEIIDNPQAIRFLRDELPKYSASDVASVRNKLSRLLLDEHIGASFCQPKNIVWPRLWMDEGKVVLANLASGIIGADHAHFAGGMLVSLIHRAALARSTVRQSERRPFFLYIDEFQNLQTTTLSSILSEGRKYGLYAILAHQQRGQLRPELANAIGNCGTKVIFQPTVDDLRYTIKTLNGVVNEEDLQNLGVGEALVVAGHRIAQVKTAYSKDKRYLRDPFGAALHWAEKHYISSNEQDSETPAARPRRRKFHDFLGPGKGENDGN